MIILLIYSPFWKESGITDLNAHCSMYDALLCVRYVSLTLWMELRYMGWWPRAPSQVRPQPTRGSTVEINGVKLWGRRSVAVRPTFCCVRGSPRFAFRRKLCSFIIFISILPLVELETSSFNPKSCHTWLFSLCTESQMQGFYNTQSCVESYNKQ